jgi:hypothetical protein
MCNVFAQTLSFRVLCSCCFLFTDFIYCNNLQPYINENFIITRIYNVRYLIFFPVIVVAPQIICPQGSKYAKYPVIHIEMLTRCLFKGLNLL